MGPLSSTLLVTLGGRFPTKLGKVIFIAWQTSDAMVISATSSRTCFHWEQTTLGVLSHHLKCEMKSPHFVDFSTKRVHLFLASRCLFCGIEGGLSLLFGIEIFFFSKILVSVNFFARNSGAEKSCANFMGAWKKCALSVGKTHAHKIPRFRGGG